MSWPTLLPANDRPALPWKNGQGITWQVAISPQDASIAAFDWRVSIAKISQDGDFSSFPGVDRTIAVVDGAGVRLTIDGVEETLVPFQALDFSGDATTYCRLIDGPTLDLNLMTTRSRARGSIEFATVTGAVSVAARAVIAVTGEVQLSTGPWRAHLAPLDAALLDNPVTVSGERATIALIRVRPL